MKSVTIQEEDFVVVVDSPKCTLVLTRRQFIEALQRGKVWVRRKRQEQREAEAKEIAQAKRARVTTGA
jgi:hypothetical protein